MTDKKPPKVNFSSPEEFADLCWHMALRLHFLNRVAIGEQRFVSEVGEMLTRLGATFRDHYKDPAVRDAFGDGWTRGTVARDDQPQALHDLMYPRDD